MNCAKKEGAMLGSSGCTTISQAATFILDTEIGRTTIWSYEDQGRVRKCERGRHPADGIQ